MLSLERMGKEIHTNRILAGKPERRRKFGRPERKREDVCWVNVVQNKEKRWILAKKAM